MDIVGVLFMLVRFILFCFVCCMFALCLPSCIFLQLFTCAIVLQVSKLPFPSLDWIRSSQSLVFGFWWGLCAFLALSCVLAPAVTCSYCEGCLCSNTATSVVEGRGELQLKTTRNSVVVCATCLYLFVKCVWIGLGHCIYTRLHAVLALVLAAAFTLLPSDSRAPFDCLACLLLQPSYL